MAQNQTPNVPNVPDNQEPLIPPIYLVIIGIVGLALALVVALTQPEFGVVGYGGLGLGLLSLIAAFLLAPQEAMALVTGRTVRFGGLSILVTLILLTAFVFLYIFVRNANLEIDLTESDQFSLTQESRDAMTPFGIDPSIPRVKIIGFYNAASGAQRDQAALLLEDYAEASGGKITVEYADVDRQAPLATLYGITRPTQLVVVADNPEASGQAVEAGAIDALAPAAPQLIQTDETGFTPDVNNAEIINSIDQQTLTNAILKVAAQGSFVAYFLQVQDSEGDQMTSIRSTLEGRYDWTVEDVSLLDFAGTTPAFTLNDPNRDGELMVIAGGTRPLAEQELALLQDYLNNGGDLILFAGNNFNDQGISLATDAALNDYLVASFGIRINNDVVIDQVQAFQSPLIPGATDFDTTSYITTNQIDTAASAVLFEVPHSLTVSTTPPPNVTVTSLLRSSPTSFARTDFAVLLAETEIARPADAVQQPYVLAASAENTQTGAKIVVYGSTSPGLDTFAQLNVQNIEVAFNSIVWATNFDNFFQQISIVQQEDPTQTPILLSEQDLRNYSFITLGLVPFGILALGALVWWANRERRTAA